MWKPSSTLRSFSQNWVHSSRKQIWKYMFRLQDVSQLRIFIHLSSSQYSIMMIDEAITAVSFWNLFSELSIRSSKIHSNPRFTSNLSKMRILKWKYGDHNGVVSQKLLKFSSTASGSWIHDQADGDLFSKLYYAYLFVIDQFYFRVEKWTDLKWTFLRDSIQTGFGQLIRLPVTSKEKVKAWRHFTRREKSLWRHRHFFPNIYLRKKPRENNWPEGFRETIERNHNNL